MICYHQRNPAGGFIGTHNGRCARGITAPEVHMRATHHVRSGSACANICADCAAGFEKHKSKDIEVSELEAVNA